MYSIKCYTGCGPNLLPRSTKCYTGCGPNLGAKIHDIEAQLKEITEAQSEWAKRCEVSRSSNGSLPFVTNGRTKLLKVHQVSVDRMGHPPYHWRARCGFRFAFSGFTRYSTLVDFDKKTWCVRASLAL